MLDLHRQFTSSFGILARIHLAGLLTLAIGGICGANRGGPLESLLLVGMLRSCLGDALFIHMSEVQYEVQQRRLMDQSVSALGWCV